MNESLFGFQDDPLVFIDGLNISTTLSLRTKQKIERGETTVLSVCAGRQDYFVRAVLKRLHDEPDIHDVNLLHCGPVKVVDPHIKNAFATATEARTRAKSKKAYNTRFHYKSQVNLPTETQWKIYRPDIVIFSMQHLSQTWCVKNQPNLHSFAKLQRKRREFAGNGDDGASSGDDADGEESDCGNESEHHNKQQTLLTKKWTAKSRPTIHQSQVLKRTMFLHFLSLVALHRPQIVFVNDTFPHMFQPERLRRDRAEWIQFLAVVQHFASETGYAVRQFGMEMSSENVTDDTRSTYCNALILERLENGIRTENTAFVKSCCATNNSDLIAASNWLFYDCTRLCCDAHAHLQIDRLMHRRADNDGKTCRRKRHAQRNEDDDDDEDDAADGQRRKSKRRKTAVWRRRVNSANTDNFPRYFSEATAHYAVAQVCDVLRSKYRLE